MISKKQKQVLEFIISYSKEHGISPSLEEIATHFDFLKYPSSAHYHVVKLQEEGYLERETGKPRSIGVYADKTIKAPVFTRLGIDAVSVPILGAVNAGPAVLFAEENILGYLKISRSLLNKKDNIFSLRVEGNSMNNARINGKTIEEGDFVMIDPDYKNPRNGDYVLSIIDGCANIKKFQRDQKTGEITLVSESKSTEYKPIHISSEDDFMINGKVVGVIKK